MESASAWWCWAIEEKRQWAEINSCEVTPAREAELLYCVTKHGTGCSEEGVEPPSLEIFQNCLDAILSKVLQDCGWPGLNMFYLKYSGCSHREVLMESENPAEVVQHWANLMLCLEIPAQSPPSSHYLENGCSCMSTKQAEKSGLHKRHTPKWIIKGNGSPLPPLPLALLFLSSVSSLSLNPRSGHSMWQGQHKIYRLVILFFPPQQELVPSGSSMQVRMSPGCLCSASSTTWAVQGMGGQPEGSAVRSMEDSALIYTCQQVFSGRPVSVVLSQSSGVSGKVFSSSTNVCIRCCHSLLVAATLCPVLQEVQELVEEVVKLGTSGAASFHPSAPLLTPWGSHLPTSICRSQGAHQGPCTQMRNLGHLSWARAGTRQN